MWHSLGIEQGFLTTMANLNFYGSFSTAQPISGIGGDMVSIFEGDLQDISEKTWYVLHVPISTQVLLIRRTSRAGKIGEFAYTHPFFSEPLPSFFSYPLNIEIIYDFSDLAD